MLLVLPFLEQQNLHDKWDFSKNVKDNQTVATTDIAAFYCPSRRGEVRSEDVPMMFLQWESGGTDYGGCIATINTYHNGDTAYGGNACGHSNDRRHFFARFGAAGIFLPDEGTTWAGISDGTTNTLMAGELQRLLPPAGTSPTFSVCAETSHDGWAVGGVSTTFNSHSNLDGGDYHSPGGLNNGFFESAGSEHPGGAMFCLADGSVRFLGEDIDTLLNQQFGSIAGGEVAPIP